MLARGNSHPAWPADPASPSRSIFLTAPQGIRRPSKSRPQRTKPRQAGSTWCLPYPGTTCAGTTCAVVHSQTETQTMSWSALLAAKADRWFLRVLYTACCLWGLWVTLGSWKLHLWSRAEMWSCDPFLHILNLRVFSFRFLQHVLHRWWH